MTPLQTIAPLSVADTRLCELAKNAFELGLRNGAVMHKESRQPSSVVVDVLLGSKFKKQRKALRRVYDAAFKFQKKHNGNSE